MTTAEKVKQVLEVQLGVDGEEVIPAARLAEDLGADSLDTVELVMAFEEEFGLEISDEDMDNLTTVEKIVVYIDTKLALRKAAK